MTDTTPLTTADLSAEHTSNSVTGFDEIAITKTFGDHPGNLRANPTMFMRALIFVSQRRHGLTDAQAYAAAMSLPIVAVNEFFPDEPDDLDDEDPAGKEQQPSS